MARELALSLRGVFQASLGWGRKYFVSDALLDVWRQSRPEGAASSVRMLALLRLLAARAFTLQNIVFFFLFFLVLLSMAIPLWIERRFGEVSLESIIFTLNSPLSGAANHYIVKIVKQLLLAGLLAACILRAVILVKRKSKIVFGLFCLLIAAATLGNAAHVADKYDVYGYYVRRTEPSTFIDEHYAEVDIKDIAFPQRRKNLIILVLESMEDTFYDQTLFPEPLIPGLKDIQDKNVAFLNWAPTPGSGWTIAGITAFLFGVNLNMPIHGNAYANEFGGFMPHATSILEVLEANGYSINLMKGASSKFSGMDNLLKSHCRNPHIYDRLFFENAGYDDPESKSSWGYRDKFIYSRMREVITKLSRDENPFFLLIETVDTHSKAVSYGDYPQKYGDDRDAFADADRMAADFIHWLQQQDFYADTVLLAVGDHLYMSPNLGDVDISIVPRHIYTTFLNTPYSPASIDRNRAFVSFDLAPTLLESIGATVPGRRFGLGRSLFSKEKNLIELYGLKALKDELPKYSRLYQSFF